jgi:hypothetical protein
MTRTSESTTDLTLIIYYFAKMQAQMNTSTIFSVDRMPRL